MMNQVIMIMTRAYILTKPLNPTVTIMIIIQMICCAGVHYSLALAYLYAVCIEIAWELLCWLMKSQKQNEEVNL